MNDQVQQQLTAAVASDMPLEQVVHLLRRLKEHGVGQAEVYAFLEAWHRASPDEQTDDRILEVADFVAGFCASHMKIWDTQMA